MGRFDPYSRRVLQRRRAAWLRGNGAVVAVVMVGFALMLAIATAVVVIAGPAPFRWYMLGAVHVGLGAGALHLLNSGFLAHDREAIWHVRGAWGEDNTRSELQRARRRRLIWGWVDSIGLQAGDLDHVVVTRGGGLVVIDSKWRSQVTSDDTAQMERAALRAKSRAEGLARTLLKSERAARHRANAQPLRVTSVVVMWGPVQGTMPGEVVREGVTFLPGRQLLPWLRGLDGDSVTRDAARDVLERLKNYRAAAWQGA